MKSRSSLFQSATCSGTVVSATGHKSKVQKTPKPSSKPSKPSPAAMPALTAQAITHPSPLPTTPVPEALPLNPEITPFQKRVLTALLQIPEGRVSTYGALARALNSAPRAVGGALRRNPWAPAVPCHRIVQESGYIGGFMGTISNAPSGVNCERKLRLLAGENVRFDAKGFLVNKAVLWDDFHL